MKCLDVKAMGAIILAMIVLLVAMADGPGEAVSAEEGWLGAMTRAVLVEQEKVEAWGRAYAPYVAQLKVVREHL